MAGMNSSVSEREAPPDVPMWAKRTFGYGGQQLDRGQVFKFKNLPNDRLLYALGYVSPVPVGAPTFACRVCGATFLDVKMRDSHGRSAHEERAFVPPPAPERQVGESVDAYRNRLDEWSQVAGRMSEAREEQRDKMEDAVAPLDLTKTAASKK